MLLYTLPLLGQEKMRSERNFNKFEMVKDFALAKNYLHFALVIPLYQMLSFTNSPILSIAFSIFFML
jgi:hypothetical protein